MSATDVLRMLSVPVLPLDERGRTRYNNMVTRMGDMLV